MEKIDMDKLFELLRVLYPNARQVQAGNGLLKKTWQLVLEPYGYEAVRAAAVDYARGNRFFPDVADLTTRCPAAGRGGRPMTVHREEDIERLEAMARRLEAEHRAAGVPTLDEALDMGWTLRQWDQACHEAEGGAGC